MSQDIDLQEIILIIGEDSANATVLNLLKKFDFGTLTASAGEEGLRIAKHKQPDLILLNIQPEGFDGFETCQKLKYCEQTKEIPVIFLSGFGGSDQKARCFTVGGVDVVEKPYQPEEFLARLKTHLTIRRQKRGLSELNARLNLEIVEKKRAFRSLLESKAAFKAILEGTADVVGKDFFDKLVYTLKEWLGCDVVLVGELIEKQRVRSISMVFNGEKVDDFSYDLHGTPCDVVRRKGFCIYPDHVTKLFPEDEILIEYGIRGYMGIPLQSSLGEGVGILVALTRGRFDPPENVEDIMRILSARAAAELQRMKVLDALKVSEERFRGVFQTSPVGIALVDTISQRILKANYSFLKITGYTLEEITGLTVKDITHPDDWEREQGKICLRLEDEIPEYKLEKRYVRKDGEIRWVHVTGDVLHTGYESAPLAIANVLDITDRIHAERVLAETKKEYKQLYDNAPDMYVSVEPKEGKIVKCNRTLCEKLGYGEEELAGKPVTSIYHPDCQENAKSFFKTFQLTGMINNAELTLKDRNGDRIHVMLNAKAIRDEDGRILHSISSLRDITELKNAREEKEKLQAQLRQAQKLEAIGTLAGGIAHDFNNILFPIMGYAEMMVDELPPESLEHGNAREIVKASKRARDLVQQILAFGRKGEKERKPILVQPLVKETLKLARSTIPTTIEIRQDIRKTRPVMGDPTQIHQVLMNIITNAFQAMRETGGLMELKLEETRIDRAYDMRQPLIKPGKYAVISVRDTGVGMDESVVKKIFEPYFSTKRPGTGTGLGLAVVHGIVEEHGGFIGVDSEPGKGSEFHVYLPLIQKMWLEEKLPEDKEPEKGNESILLIDDEKPVAALLSKLLTGLGYRVTVTNESPEALKLFQAEPDRFDLVITDMTMPHMTGVVLFEKIKEIRSDIPVIICTGYSELINSATASSMGFSGYLVKPVMKSELARIVRNSLEKIPFD